MRIKPFSLMLNSINGVTPIRCSPITAIQITAKKPCYLPLPKVDDTSLGAELKRKRLTSELTQADCAKMFGVNKSTYQDYEWNKIIPKIKKRKMVNQFLGFNYWDDDTGSLENRVLLHRIENQLTRIDLGNLIGICDSTIERVEKNVDAVSEKLKTKIESFIFRT